MNKLTGITWAYNPLSQDYCFAESIICLKQFCDEVIVLDAGSTDGSAQWVKYTQDKKTRLILCDNEEWKAQHGKEKLTYFTDKAIEKVNTDWIFSLQADEILHEDSYAWVRQAINEKESESFLCTRINLWASPYKMLDVPHERKPCSTQIVRLAKTKFRAYGDAESLAVDPQTLNEDYLQKIRIFHMGFVRKREVHPAKIRHMQGEVFKVGVDPKLEGMEIFDPYKWFAPEDLKSIDEPLPKIIQPWADERVYNDIKLI